jgi:protein-S-isoprenylcysteine O-methyltransferase Ste14
VRIVRGLGYLISTIVIYLGIPLLGWGIGDLQAFFSMSQRLGYALVVVVVGFAVGWKALDDPVGIRGGTGRRDKLVARQRFIRIAITLLLFVALLFLPFADRQDIGVLTSGPVIRWIGVILFGLGIGLVFWSGVALGRFYSGDVTLQEDHRLITSGPYRFVRHPRYAGAILLSFGLSLTFNSWMGLVASVVFIGIILLRIKDEENLMREEFGHMWEGYCEHTKRLIPLIY